MTKDVRAIRANERYRSISRTLFQFGGALIAATVVKAYNDNGVSGEDLLWFAGAILLISIAWMTLGLLESEDD